MISQIRNNVRWIALLVALPIAALPAGWSALGAWRTATGTGFLTLNLHRSDVLTWVLALVGFTVLGSVLAASRWFTWVPWIVSGFVLSLLAALSGNLRSAAAALFTVSACLTIGSRVLTSQTFPDSARGNPLVELAAGFAIVQTVLFAIGTLGLLKLPVGLLVLAVGALGVPSSARKIRRSFAGLSNDPTSRFLLGTIGGLTTMVWVWACAPDLQFDAMYAKAWLPSVWASSGSTRLLTDHPVLGTVGTDLTLSVPGHLIGGVNTGQFLQALCGIFIMLCPWWVMRDKSRQEARRAGLLSITIATSGHFVWQMGTAYDDLIVSVLFLGILLVAFPAPQRTDGSTRLAIHEIRVVGVLGLMLGALVASKLYLIPFAASVFVIWSIRKKLTQIATCMLGGVGGALPLFALRWFQTGNPVFPQFNSVFKSKFFPPLSTNWNMPYDKRSGLRDALVLPFRAALQPFAFVEVMPGGGMGFLVVGFGLIFVGVIFARDRRIPYVLLMWLAVWWLQLRYLRYALPLLIASLVLIRVALPPLRFPKKVRSLMGSRVPVTAAVCVAIAVNAWPIAASFWNIPERFPVRVAVGQETRADYLRRTLAAYPVVEFLKDHAEKRDRVMAPSAVVMARTLFPTQVDVSPQWEADQQIQLDRNRDRVAPSATLTERYRDVGFRWIVIATSERLAPTGVVDPVAIPFPQTLAWAGNGFEIYELLANSQGNSVRANTSTQCSVEPGQRVRCGPRSQAELIDGVLTVSDGCDDDLLLMTVSSADPAVPVDTVETDGPKLLSFSRATHSGVLTVAQSRSNPRSTIRVTGLSVQARAEIAIRLGTTCDG